MCVSIADLFFSRRARRLLFVACTFLFIFTSRCYVSPTKFRSKIVEIVLCAPIFCH